MVAHSAATSRRRQRRDSNLSRKLAALAGATGAIAAGTDAQAEITYTPTAGVAAASNIPGFTFVDWTNVTLGALRPPAVPGNTNWDVDGDSTADFALNRTITNSSLNPFNVARLLPLGAPGANRMMATFYGSLLPLAVGYGINAENFLYSQDRNDMVKDGVIMQGQFLSDAGQFGFSFTSGTNSYFGWGSLVFEPGTNTYKITEAYYSTTPGGAINVGDVPMTAPVPEPSGMMLLAAGAAGVAVWRTRKKQPAADA